MALPSTAIPAEDYGSEAFGETPRLQSSSASPSPEDMASWSTIADAMVWVGFTDVDVPTSHASSFLLHLGYASDAMLRELGAVPIEDYLEEVASWKHEDLRPALAYRRRAKQLGHAARVFTGVDYTAAESRDYQAKQEAHRREMEWYAAQPQPVHQAASIPAPSAAAVSKGRMVALKDVVDSSRPDEVEAMTVDSMEQARAHYNR